MEVLISFIIFGVVEAFVGGPAGAAIGVVIAIITIVNEKTNGNKNDKKAEELVETRGVEPLDNKKSAVPVMME